MRSKFKYYIGIISCVMLVLASACDVFPTRTPEDPINPNSNIIPPTTPYLALDNFINSVNNAEYSNYTQCFASKISGQSKEFEYIPSGSSKANYPGLFNEWHSNEEIRNFKSIINSLKVETKPVLVINNIQYNSFSADSVNLTGDYSLSLEIKNNINVSHYLGQVLLSLYRENNGLWYINQWVDIDSKTDETGSTWSTLKASFSN